MAGKQPDLQPSGVKLQLSHIYSKANSFYLYYHLLGFPGGAVVKNPPGNAGDQETWV